MRFFILAVALFLSACVNYGTKVSQEQTQQFSKGKTTVNEVISILGKPTAVKDVDGVKSLVYANLKGTPSAASFIPVINIFATTDIESNMVEFKFDGENKLQSIESTNSKSTGSIFGTTNKSDVPK